MRVTLIAKTEYLADVTAEVMSGFRTDTDGGSALVEAAGRACYQSFSKPNPRTATNAGYIDHILEVGHFSVLEHASVSFYITGVSRSLTHELVRHRHFSYSQLSQRYVDESDTEFVSPPAIRGIPVLEDAFDRFMIESRNAYREFARRIDTTTVDLRRKEIRQAARAVLPNATETKIVVTGNYRAWRHFVHMRAAEPADVEIRALAVECLRQLTGVAPAVFGDFTIRTLPDGTEVAESPLGGSDG